MGKSILKNAVSNMLFDEYSPKTQSLDCAGSKTQFQRDWVFERLGFWTGAQAEELGFWTGAHCISDRNPTVDEIL